jgi:hypothetical protein
MAPRDLRLYCARFAAVNARAWESPCSVTNAPNEAFLSS